MTIPQGFMGLCLPVFYLMDFFRDCSVGLKRKGQGLNKVTYMYKAGSRFSGKGLHCKRAKGVGWGCLNSHLGHSLILAQLSLRPITWPNYLAQYSNYAHFPRGMGQIPHCAKWQWAPELGSYLHNYP